MPKIKVKLRKKLTRRKTNRWWYLVIWCPHCGNRIVSAVRIQNTVKALKEWLLTHFYMERRFRKPPPILFAKTIEVPIPKEEKQDGKDHD